MEDVEDPLEHPGDVSVGQERDGSFEKGREDMGRRRRRLLGQYREGLYAGRSRNGCLACYRLANVINVVITVVICICLQF